MRARWEPEAVEFLLELEGEDRIDFLIKKFKRAAKKRGWKERTETAILVKIKRLGLSQVATLDGMNCTKLAGYLGIDRDRVHNWVIKGLLKSTKGGGSEPRRIKLADFIEFAKVYPVKLQGIHPDNLVLLLPRDLVQTILITPFDNTGVKLRIRRMDTNEVFGSISEAARKCHYSKTHIGKSLRSGKTVGGVKFQVIEISRVDYSYLSERYKL